MTVIQHVIQTVLTAQLATHAMCTVVQKQIAAQGVMEHVTLIHAHHVMVAVTHKVVHYVIVHATVTDAQHVMEVVIRIHVLHVT